MLRDPLLVALLVVFVTGALIGFKFQVTSVRPLQLGLYRPVKGTCAFQLLKGWTPKISNIGENVVGILYFVTRHYTCLFGNYSFEA